MVFVTTRGKITLIVALAVVCVVGLALLPRSKGVRQDLPSKFSDRQFWDLITQTSEPGGYFRSENFVSNESAFQRVIPELRQKVRQEGVYLGVGPEQNFTYIAAFKPRVAFIIDIRRQNMLLHLVYKALFELADNRKEFLSRLFSRPVPKTLPGAFTTEQLFDAFENTSSNSDFAKENLDLILQRLRDRHHFDLSADDSKTIEFVYNAFVTGGPEIRYSFPNQNASRRFPTYSELMLETDSSTENEGQSQSYMATEENFQTIRRMEVENRIIPIVGDFAGNKALRSVGEYLKEHGAAVSMFYTSNVEFYLFQTEDWRKFSKTVSELPMNDDSVFIRSYFNNYGFQFQNPPSWLFSPPQSYTLVDSMPSFVNAFTAGHIHNYFDVIRRSTP
jgi:hypothetical protein